MNEKDKGSDMDRKGLMRRLINSMLLVTGLVFLSGCGGGGNDPDRVGTVSIGGLILGNDVIQVEMLKDLASAVAVFEVTAQSTFEEPTAVVANITLDRYEITFTRDSGGPVIGPYSRPLGLRINAGSTGSNLPSDVEFEAIVFSTEDKLFSAFAREYNATYAPSNMTGVMRIFASNDAGDDFTADIGFQVEAATYGPNDSLFPVVEGFNQTTELNLGETYLAQWRTSNLVSAAQFTLPWGNQFPIAPDLFPVGSIEASTAGLGDLIAAGTTREFPSGLLVVANPFGTDESTGDAVNITAPADPPPDPVVPVTINRFFSNPTEVELGNPVDLFWEVGGDPSSLTLLPNTYSGEVVSFEGKNLSFDSLSITPELSVRPLLRAARDDLADTQLLESSIIVNQPPVVEPTPANIIFFSAGNDLLRIGERPVFFWNTSGDVTKVEIFPINDQRIDVTGLDTFLGAPLLEAGVYTFTLIAYGSGGTVEDLQSINLTVSEINNVPIEILDLVQQPGNSIDNGDDASFSFTVSDPERFDSSYRIEKIAGDLVSFFPKEGVINGGLGDVGVRVVDFTDNDNEFFTFEVSAYDDPIFGASRGSTRAVELVTFQTTGILPDTAPVISDLEFVDAGGDIPGSEGVITFSTTDPDTPDLRWRVDIIAGDVGGTLTPFSGTFDSFGGDVAVDYVDDPDTPDEPVVFLVRVEETSGAERQFSLATLLVNKGVGDTDDDPTGTPTTTEPIGFPFNSLFSNASGTVDTDELIANGIIYYNGSAASPRFYRFSDLSGEITNASFVFDFNHRSGDPSSIVDVDFARDFMPTGEPANNGSLNFIGYFANAGDTGGPSASPIDGGVSRWRMTFNAEDFRTGTNMYNLPSSGNASYTVTITVTDTGGEEATLTKAVVVTVP